MKTIRKKIVLLSALALCLERPIKAVEPIIAFVSCTVAGVVIARYLTDSDDDKTRNSIIGAVTGGIAGIGLADYVYQNNKSDEDLLREFGYEYDAAARELDKRLERYPIGTKVPLREAIRALEWRISHDRGQLKKLRDLRHRLGTSRVSSTHKFALEQSYSNLYRNIDELHDKYNNYIDKLELALGELKAQQLADKPVRIVTWELPARTTILSTTHVTPNPALARLATPQETVVRVS